MNFSLIDQAKSEITLENDKLNLKLTPDLGGKITALILKADVPPQARETHREAVSVMQQGKLVHIDGAGHNLHHDELRRTTEVITEFLSTL